MDDQRFTSTLLIGILIFFLCVTLLILCMIFIRRYTPSFNVRQNDLESSPCLKEPNILEIDSLKSSSLTSFPNISSNNQSNSIKDSSHPSSSSFTIEPNALTQYNTQSNVNSKLGNQQFTKMFSNIHIGHLRFLLMDCPNDENCESFVNELKAHNVTTVVRVCEATYDKNQFVNNGIEFIDLPYPDGTVPTNQEIVKFIQLCQKTFGSISIPNHIIQDEIITPIQNPKVIAVHCMVGLGRAPLLVAIALIEAGFAPLDAIEYIRQAKRGAMNPSQLKYLLDYKKQKRSSLGFLSQLFKR